MTRNNIVQIKHVEMEVIVFEKDTYWKMQKQLMSLFQQTLKQIQEKEEIWISPEEAQELLGIKRGRMQQLRDQGAIKYSQHGRKIKYSKSSILNYLNDHIPTI